MFKKDLKNNTDERHNNIYRKSILHNNFIMLLKTDFNKRRLIEKIERLDLAKRSYAVTITPIYKNRSLNQNSLMWLWIAVISADSGIPSKALHEKFKKMFIRFQDQEPENEMHARIERDQKLTTIMGIQFEEEPTTTALNTVNFKKYMDLIHKVADDFNIQLPNPDDKNMDEIVAYYQQYI
jgi:hypothetical protein